MHVCVCVFEFVYVCVCGCLYIYMCLIANRSKPLNKTLSADLSICLRGGRPSPPALDVRQSFHGNEFLPLKGVDAASSDSQILGILGNGTRFMFFFTAHMGGGYFSLVIFACVLYFHVILCVTLSYSSWSKVKVRVIFVNHT